MPRPTHLLSPRFHLPSAIHLGPAAPSPRLYPQPTATFAVVATAIPNNAIITTAHASRATVEIKNPVAAPTPAFSVWRPVFFATHFSAAIAPNIVPRISAGSEKNIPTNAPPLAPAIPHFVPPNNRVPNNTPPKSAITDNSQNTPIHTTVVHDKSSGRISLCTTAPIRISVVPGSSGTITPMKPTSISITVRHHVAISSMR